HNTTKGILHSRNTSGLPKVDHNQDAQSHKPLELLNACARAYANRVLVSSVSIPMSVSRGNPSGIDQSTPTAYDSDSYLVTLKRENRSTTEVPCCCIRPHKNCEV
ncbi:phosphate transporter 4, partial [Striga asiatica]